MIYTGRLYVLRLRASDCRSAELLKWCRHWTPRQDPVTFQQDFARACPCAVEILRENRPFAAPYCQSRRDFFAEISVFPMRQRKAGDWHPYTMFQVSPAVPRLEHDTEEVLGL